MKSPQCLMGLFRGGYLELLKWSFVELPWSLPPYGGDRRAPGLHISLCSCLQGETGKLSPSFVAAALILWAPGHRPGNRACKQVAMLQVPSSPSTAKHAVWKVDAESGIADTPGCPGRRGCCLL